MAGAWLARPFAEPFSQHITEHVRLGAFAVHDVDRDLDEVCEVRLSIRGDVQRANRGYLTPSIQPSTVATICSLGFRPGCRKSNSAPLLSACRNHAATV